MAEQTYYAGTGRRKTAVAQVKIMPGSGVITVNGKPIHEYFRAPGLAEKVLEPFRVAGLLGAYDATVKVEGGGISGQVGAVMHGLARAIVAVDEGYRQLLRKLGLLTRDPRVKERKKPGLRRARKAKQYTKR